MSLIIIPTSPGPMYIKREDAPDFFKTHLRNQIIISIFYTIFTFFLIFFFNGEINSLFNQTNSVNLYLFTGTLSMMLGIIIYWALLAKTFSKKYKEDFFNKIKKYNDNEMINWNKLVDVKRYWLSVGLYITGIMLGLIFYLLPVLIVMK
mgnify:CR=1 FL=1